MDINQFFNEYTKEIDLLLNEGTFIGLNNIDELEDGTFTLLFDVAVYNISKRNNLTMLPENPTGRGGYSDITICSSDGKNKQIEIEHENRPLHKNKKKIALQKSLGNLMLSEAGVKILITYTFQDISESELIKMCKDYLEEKYPKRGEIYLFFADNEFENAQKEFKMIKL